MDTKKAVIAGLVTLVGIGGIVSGALLLQRNTELRELAAVPGGRASVSLLPESGNFDVGDSFPVSVYMNTDNIAVSVVSVTVRYPFSGSSPEVVASDVTINPTFTGSPDWSCPENSVDLVGGEVQVTVSCSNLSAAGFSTGTDTLLATFNLSVERNPSQVPFSISFEPSSSRIIQKSNQQDILGLPSSTGTYTIGGVTDPTATTAPAGSTITPSVTGTLTVTPTKKVTATPTKVSTSSATNSGQLPDAGVSLPTVLGIGLGILAIFGSLALAL